MVHERLDLQPEGSNPACKRAKGSFSSRAGNRSETSLGRLANFNGKDRPCNHNIQYPEMFVVCFFVQVLKVQTPFHPPKTSINTVTSKTLKNIYWRRGVDLELFGIPWSGNLDYLTSAFLTKKQRKRWAEEEKSEHNTLVGVGQKDSWAVLPNTSMASFSGALLRARTKRFRQWWTRDIWVNVTWGEDMSLDMKWRQILLYRQCL